MNQSYQEPQTVSSNTIDKQVKQAEIQQKYLTRIGNPHTAAKSSVWEFVRKLFRIPEASAASKESHRGHLSSNE